MDNYITTSTAGVGADWIATYSADYFNVLRGYEYLPASAHMMYTDLSAGSISGDTQDVVNDDYGAHGIETLQDFDTTAIDKYIESLKKEVVTTEK